MSTPDFISGTKFRLLRESDSSPGTYEFICLAVTKSFERTKDFEDATAFDCDAPDAIPWTKSTARSRGWSMSFSGNADAVRMAKFEADHEADGAHKYQLLLALTAGAGGRTYTGLAHVGNLVMSSNNNGIVTFSAQLRGDGALVKAAVA